MAPTSTTSPRRPGPLHPHPVQLVGGAADGVVFRARNDALGNRPRGQRRQLPRRPVHLRTTREGRGARHLARRRSAPIFELSTTSGRRTAPSCASRARRQLHHGDYVFHRAAAAARRGEPDMITCSKLRPARTSRTTSSARVAVPSCPRLAAMPTPTTRGWLDLEPAAAPGRARPRSGRTCVRIGAVKIYRRSLTSTARGSGHSATLRAREPCATCGAHSARELSRSADSAVLAWTRPQPTAAPTRRSATISQGMLVLVRADGSGGWHSSRARSARTTMIGRGHGTLFDGGRLPLRRATPTIELLGPNGARIT